MFHWKIDYLASSLVRTAAVFACSIVVFVIAFLTREAWPAISELGTRLLGDESWHPKATATAGTFGIGPIIVGSLTVTAGAVAIAAPVGVTSAVFSEYYAPRGIAVVYRRLVELLAGIPSVVFGFWGLVVLAPWIARISPPGQSLLCGMLIVAIMILPTIMLVVQSALATVPRIYLEGAVALGMGRWSVIRYVVLPTSRRGIATGVMLGATRAVGETMAVVMVCGNVVKIPQSLFDPVRTLTANMALEMSYALGMHRSALFSSGLMLMLACAIAILSTHVWSRRA